MRNYTFDNTVYQLDAVWDSWPEQLYTPQDLMTSEMPQASTDINFTQTEYVTYKLSLSLQPGTDYGLFFESSKYAMRLFVGGKEAMSVGSPGATRETTEPREYKGAYYFTPLEETTEILVQVANFVHREGGQPPDLTIGEQQGIERLERESDIKSALITGCLLAAFLFHLGIFILNSSQRASLLFALFCLLLAIQSSSFIIYLIPSYDWFIATRIEYLINLGALITLILLIRKLFPQTLGIWIYAVFISLCVIFCVMVLFSDSTLYTQLLPVFQAVSILLALYILIRLAMTLREKNLKNILAFLGLLLMGICGIGDVLARNKLIPEGFVESQVFNIGTGAALLVFCYVLVLALEQSEVNKTMDDTRQALLQAEERYTKLIEQQQGSETLSDRLSEFGLTKREREVASLLLNGKSREEIADLLFVSLGTVNTHCSNVYKKVGCGSVGELAHHVNPDWFS